MYYFSILRRPSDNSRWPVIYTIKPVDSTGRQKFRMVKRLHDASSFTEEGWEQVLRQNEIIKKNSSLIKAIFKEGYSWKD